LIKQGIIKAELVIDALDEDTDPKLVWRVVVSPPDSTDLTGATTSDPGATYYISANGDTAGTVQRAVSNADALTIGSAATTTATDELGATRQLNISRLSLLIFNIDLLDDNTRDIETYTTNYLFFFLGAPITPGTIAFKGLTGWNTSAVSAQANLAEVYDYYSNVLGLDSFDGAGATITASVNYNPHESSEDYADGYENAFWDADKQQFMFGDAGDLEDALDIVGHEYTHAVIAYAMGEGDGTPLDYGESGALNEAYADIMGSLIEGKTGTGRWLMGEDSTFTGGPLRNLADPTSIETDLGPYRDDYNDLYTEDDDEGGEHVNSTIFSHAAYLMMTDARTADITEQQWADLYYMSMYHLSPGADFADGRTAVLTTAGEMNWTDAQKAAINDAFDAVHIA
jgi:bacillolysin